MDRSLSSASSSRDGAGDGNLAVRRGRHADNAVLATLAGLAGSRPLTGERVVAAVDGRIVAAVSLHDGRVIADPFADTAEAVEVLRLHTAGGRSSAARPRQGFPRLAPRRLMPQAA
jgi:ketosteroid isomerase-like protein